MAGLSNTKVDTYKGNVIQDSEFKIKNDIKIWDGSDIESAKDNGGNDLWDNED